MNKRDQAAVAKAVANLRSMGVTMHRVTKTSAELCREKGWSVGDVLEGVEGRLTTRIRLTAIGTEGVLAQVVETNGEPCRGHESNWTLMHRDWRRVTPSESDPHG